MSLEGRQLGIAAGAVGLLMGGLLMIVTGWQSAGPWLTLGVGSVQLAAVVSVAAYFAGKRANLDDAFEAGYQAGFHRGERVKPKVIRMPDRDQSA